MGKGYSANLADKYPITIGNKEFKVHPLTMGDFADAEAMIKSKKLTQFLEETRLIAGVNLPDKVRSLTIAEILNKDYPAYEVIDNHIGQLYLLFASIKKGAPGISFDRFVKDLKKIDLATLKEVVWYVSGLLEDSEDEVPEEERPLEVEPTISTSEQPETFQQ